MDAGRRKNAVIPAFAHCCPGKLRCRRTWTQAVDKTSSSRRTPTAVRGKWQAWRPQRTKIRQAASHYAVIPANAGIHERCDAASNASRRADKLDASDSVLVDPSVRPLLSGESCGF
jgi:hypothetical protein